MKKISLLAFFTFFLSVNNVLATEVLMPTHANTFTTDNITSIQHSIMTNAMQTFEGTAAAALGGRSKFVRHSDNDVYLYGTLPMYGRPHLYGEFGDEETITPIGRNGGDEISETDAQSLELNRPEINSAWLTWQHFDEDVKFKGYEELDTDTDLIMLGLAGGEAQYGIGISEWGIFGGFVGSNQKNSTLKIDENGGFFGIYTGYNIKSFNLSFAANAGTLYNKITNDYLSDEFANAWLGAAINATYNIAIDDSFTLQPGVYAGYTWLGSANYISSTDANIANQNINMFEIAPEFRAIKHIGKMWFASFNFRYAFMMGHGGIVLINGIQQEDLSIKDYAEYGIGIEKSIDRFNIGLNINRRDGGHTGWSGGFNLKYIF